MPNKLDKKTDIKKAVKKPIKSPAKKAVVKGVKPLRSAAKPKKLTAKVEKKDEKRVKKTAPKKPQKPPVKVVAKALKPQAKKAVADKKPSRKDQGKVAVPPSAKALEKKSPLSASNSLSKLAKKDRVGEPKASAVKSGKPTAPVVAKANKSPGPSPADKVGKKPIEIESEPIVEEVLATDDGLLEDEAEENDEVVLTDAEGRRYCRVKDCDQLSSVDGYCRYHYLLFWKKIQVRKKILTEGKLERYIEDLTARYPDKFLDVLRKDLRSEKEFLAAIQELEIDESAGENEFEDEAQTFIDEVRGMGEPAARDDEDF